MSGVDQEDRDEGDVVEAKGDDKSIKDKKHDSGAADLEKVYIFFSGT